MSESADDLLGFELVFDKDGVPVVVDAAGKQIEPADGLEFPIHATKIESIETYAIVKFQSGNEKYIDIVGRRFRAPGYDGFEIQSRKSKKYFTKDDVIDASIKFKKDGGSFISSNHGKKIAKRNAPSIDDVLTIESIDTVLMVRYRGSHVQLIKIGGRYYAIPLAH